MTFKPGDKVICKNIGYSIYELKLNNEYIIKSVGVKDGAEYVTIIVQDSNFNYKYRPSRFELTKSQIRKNKLKIIYESVKI